MSFQVIIDYDNIFFNNEGLGSGKRGTVFNYHGDIIKIQYCEDLVYDSIYSKRNPYKPTQNDNVLIEYYKNLASVVNKLPHFIKIKGYLICPNLNGKKAFGTCYFSSIIYENAGKLTRTRLPFNKQSASQLLQILKSFKKFNLAGWFHEDIQGCNNIEPNQNSQLYVIDYEDLKYVNGSRVILNNIKNDIYKMMTCILTYTSGSSIATHDDIEFDINLIILQEYWKKKPISYNEPNLNDKQVAIVKIQNGLIYTEKYNPGEAILSLNRYINYCIGELESIQIVNINICEFIFLMENYVLNHLKIIDFMSNIMDNILEVNNNKNSLDYKKCIDIMKTIENNIIGVAFKTFYDQDMYFNFDDIKYIIELLYNNYIEYYENYIKKFD
jgi:hypothetical protein